jgi:phosphoenolpyruvate carboxylase
VGIFARVAATARALDADVGTLGTTAVAARAYGGPGELSADLGVIATALADDGAALAGTGGCATCPATSTCSGFTCARSICAAQRGPRAGRLGAARARDGERGYEALDEPDRQALLLRELWTPRPLASPHVSYGEETTQALATLAATARCAPASASARSRTTSSR